MIHRSVGRCQNENYQRVDTQTPDKGYYQSEFRQNMREEGAKPVTNPREITSLNATHNARIDDETYHRQSVVESGFHSYVAATATRLNPEPCLINSEKSCSKLP